MHSAAAAQDEKWMPKVFYSPHKVRYNYLVFFSKSFGHFSNNKKKKKKLLWIHSISDRLRLSRYNTKFPKVVLFSTPAKERKKERWKKVCSSLYKKSAHTIISFHHPGSRSGLAHRRNRAKKKAEIKRVHHILRTVTYIIFILKTERKERVGEAKPSK